MTGTFDIAQSGGSFNASLLRMERDMRDELLSSTAAPESEETRRRRVTLALATEYLDGAGPTATGATVILPWGEAIFIPRRPKPEAPDA